MKRILCFVLLTLMAGCETVHTVVDTYYDECIMVNESGVAVKVEIVIEDPSVEFPASLTLEPNQKYVWTLPSNKETKGDMPIYRPPFGDILPKYAKIYFADCPPVQYVGHELIERDPRGLIYYLYMDNRKNGKFTYIYTFTAEDYQNALNKQK